MCSVNNYGKMPMNEDIHIFPVFDYWALTSASCQSVTLPQQGQSVEDVTRHVQMNRY